MTDIINDLSTTFPESKEIVSIYIDEENKLIAQPLFDHCKKVYPERFFDFLYKNEDIVNDEEEEEQEDEYGDNENDLELERHFLEVGSSLLKLLSGFTISSEDELVPMEEAWKDYNELRELIIFP